MDAHFFEVIVRKFGQCKIDFFLILQKLNFIVLREQPFKCLDFSKKLFSSFVAGFFLLKIFERDQFKREMRQVSYDIARKRPDFQEIIYRSERVSYVNTKGEQVIIYPVPNDLVPN